MDSSARILKTHIAEALVYLPRSLQTGQH
jgi:hypothetical protein